MNEANNSQASDYDKTERAIRRLLSHTSDLRWWDMRSELSDLWDSASENSMTLQYLHKGQYIGMLPSKTRSMAKMLVYLGLVESLGVAFIDMALMLLIVNGEEMHTRGKFINHVKSLKELENLDLAYKQHFLKSHELPLFQKLVRRNLRNEIAHLKFRIEESGEIKDSTNHKVDIDSIIEDFWKKWFDITNIFDKTGLTLFLDQEDRKEETNHE